MRGFQFEITGDEPLPEIDFSDKSDPTFVGNYVNNHGKDFRKGNLIIGVQTGWTTNEIETKKSNTSELERNSETFFHNGFI